MTTQKLLSPGENKILTAEEIKARLQARGITVAAWAEANGYKRQRVYRVMGGLEKCRFGVCHQIAVDLGLKLDPAESYTSNAA